MPPRLAGRGGVEGLPDRLDPAGSHHPCDVRPLDPLRRSGVDGELFHFGRQDPDLQSHQFDQEVRRPGSSCASHRDRAYWISQETTFAPVLFGQSVAINREPAFSTRFARLVVAVHCFTWSKDSRGAGPLDIGLQLLAILRHEAVRFLDEHQASAAEEREGEQLIPHLGQAGLGPGNRVTADSSSDSGNTTRATPLIDSRIK